MKHQENLILNHLKESIVRALNQLEHSDILSGQEILKLFTSPPNQKMGHFAFPCFPLAKALKKGPPQIASELANHIAEDELISEAKGVGPYLNFFIKTNKLNDLLFKRIENGEYFEGLLIDKPSKLMIEYSQPNTHKELHVGHMRNLCLGNALVRIKKYVGENVIPVTYPGDVGTHVAKCLWYLKMHHQGDIPAENKGEWLGKVYSTANLKLEDEKGTPAEEKNREQLTEILKQLHGKSGEYYDLWKETREWSLKLMHKAYDWADVKFDRWFYESEVDEPSTAIIKKLYDNGKLIKDDGAIGMDLSEEKLGFCLLLKSDGTGLYATKDVALAIRKTEEFGVEKNIYIVDDRQKRHFQQVFKVLEKVGYEDVSRNCYHLPYNVVELPSGAMSSRDGNIIPLMELVSKMEAKITEDYLERYRGQWTDEEIKKTAHAVAGGAIKYGMIRVDNNRKIVFDMDEWLKLDGETGPYLQYVHARINSLLLKFKIKGEVDSSKLTHDLELALILKLSFFNETVLTCADKNSTMGLCSYLYELCKLFNSFYAECPIGKEADKEIQKARLMLTSSVGKVIKEGLSLLGIEAPERM